MPTPSADVLKMLRALDFAIQETVLYLDVYPECTQALDYYHSLIEQRRQVMTAYEQKRGPLNIYRNVSHKAWEWTAGPWPWEPEAN